MNNDNEKQLSSKFNIVDRNERSLRKSSQEKVVNKVASESFGAAEDQLDSNCLDKEIVEEAASVKPNREAIRKQKEEKRKRNRTRLRLIPIWVRVILVTIIFIVSLVAGAMFGYGVVGDGNPTDILGKGPWLKIHDIIYKE